ncbi:hypothetical protein [Verrucosispora sioxanthis]|uniref:hypothetical protein n=1 Tax=Verrucosispora sioxanthis TaxID=2499994 RepID=UPI002E285C36|nr:hypothetical protein [Verrucosispora sioxanthis]
MLGPATDGGWWTLGLRDPGHATVLRTIATSTTTTGHRTVVALRRRGLRVACCPGCPTWTPPSTLTPWPACARRTAGSPRAVAAEVPQPAPVAR